ncbi:MAG: nucleoside triphosphate pyrophosphohydrolase [Candidatus Aminicenantes bacterium]|nr:nucleoside triphosphate pyrophosphohydrolase [Candidatus Aminicenantes bacterium]
MRIMNDTERIGLKFVSLVNILEKLRGEKGCPWDKEQDEKSIANYFLEEVYEAIDALQEGDTVALAEELGDVLLEVIFLARIFEEKKQFDISHVLDGIINKMIRRHPHVFGKETAETTREVKRKWNDMKRTEKKRESVLDGLTSQAPALLEAVQIGRRVSSCGFDWEKQSEVLQKIKEEIDEMEKALISGNKNEIEKEMGDLLFSTVNLARHLDANPELILRKMNKKFIRRFQYIEKEAEKSGRNIHQMSLQEMDKLWEEAKGME